MIFLYLFLTFFEIGLFGFGGGYGMLSLIQSEVVTRYGWLSTAEFTNIVALSQMTPGPIGINSATYCGYVAVQNAGYSPLLAILGSFTATLALMLPSIVLMIILSRLFLRYITHPAVGSALQGLRPAVVGLLAAAVLMLMTSENFSSPGVSLWQFVVSVALFIATFVGVRYIRISPILMIGLAAIAGVVLL